MKSPRVQFLAESYRSLRLFMEKNMNGKVVIFTSSGPSEGKLLPPSTLHYVAHGQTKVLLIDGDLRRLTLRKIFTEAPKLGMMDFLKSNDLEIDKYIVKDAA